MFGRCQRWASRLTKGALTKRPSAGKLPKARRLPVEVSPSLRVPLQGLPSPDEVEGMDLLYVQGGGAEG